MPVYEYRCNACHKEFEYQQRMADPDLVTCEACGSDALEKLISRTAFQLKGSGWYKDLYSSSKPDTKTAGESDKPAAGDAAASDKPASDKSASDKPASDKPAGDKSADKPAKSSDGGSGSGSGGSTSGTSGGTSAAAAASAR